MDNVENPSLSKRSCNGSNLAREGSKFACRSDYFILTCITETIRTAIKSALQVGSGRIEFQNRIRISVGLQLQTLAGLSFSVQQDQSIQGFQIRRGFQLGNGLATD